MKIIPLLCLAFLLVVSCKKEGCTESTATNYNEEAKKDDGSCNYIGSRALWFKLQKSQQMTNDFIGTLKVYIDDKLQGSIQTNKFSSSFPGCSTTDVIKISQNLGTEKSKTFTLVFKNELDTEKWSETITITGGSCSGYELK